MCRSMLWAAAALLAGGLPSLAGSPQDLCRVVVYPIQDLMMYHQAAASATSFNRSMTPAAAARGTHGVGYEQILIEYLTRSIDSDQETGQDCSIDFYPIGQALVVRGNDRVHEQIRQLLDNLRRDLEPQLEFKMLVVTVPREFFERFGLDEDLGLRGDSSPGGLDQSGEGGGCLEPHADHPDAGCCELPAEPKFRCARLNSEQLQTLLTALSKDSRCRTVSAPTLITRNSLAAQTQIQGYQQFLTGLTIRLTEGEPMFTPEMTQVVTGVHVRITGRHCPEDDVVHVEFHGTYAYLDRPPTLVPVTMSCPLPGHDTSAANHLPVTQFLQKPSLKTLGAEGEMEVPVGTTTLVYGGRIERYGPPTRLPTWLARLPYFDRWIRGASANHRSCDHLLYLVTANVCRPLPEAESAAWGRPGAAGQSQESCCAKEVAHAGNCGGGQAVETASSALVAVGHRASEAFTTQPSQPPMSAPGRLTATIDQRRVERVASQLVAKYHAACAAGDLDLAREYAQMALDLDPACFSKPFATEVAPTSCPTLVPAGGAGAFSSPTIVPTGHARPQTSDERKNLPGHPPAAEPAGEGTVDYFPIPLVPIFNTPAAETGHDGGFWRALGRTDLGGRTAKE